MLFVIMLPGHLNGQLKIGEKNKAWPQMSNVHGSTTLKFALYNLNILSELLCDTISVPVRLDWDNFRNVLNIKSKGKGKQKYELFI